MHSLKITRFDASVLTVKPQSNDWSVVSRKERSKRPRTATAKRRGIVLVAR